MINMKGNVYGRLTAIEVVGTAKNRHKIWRFNCSCGNTIQAPGSRVRHGTTSSCGCLQKELAAVRIKRMNTTHGMSHSSEFTSWVSAKNRCYYKKDKEYARYGRRGITMCPRWLNSFSAFYHDMGAKPTPKHTLERIDNNKGYSPKNCRWATVQEQAQNRRNTIIIDYLGQYITLKEFASLTGVKYATAFWRYKHHKSLTN